VIPVLGIPYMSRSDLFTEMIMSIDFPVQDIIIIDNSGGDTCPQIEGAHHVKMPHNMGVAWAWNTIIKSFPTAAWWTICNADIKFAPGDLEKLYRAMQDHSFTLLNSMAAFGVSRECIEKVGWFDEASFIPAYCEDNDFVYRARLVGVDPHFVQAGFAHFGSATIKSDPHLRDENNRTYHQNVKEYTRKWGGMMHEEVFKTPYDKGGSPRDCLTVSIAELAARSWK